VTTTQWLLGFHLLGGFVFVSAAIAVGMLYTAARRREKPSEIALLLGLTRPAVALVGVGSLATIGFGIWLAERAGFSLGDTWLSAALALWVASIVLGGVGGRSARHTRYLAERLAAEGDRPSDELRRALGDPIALGFNALSFLSLIAILGLMVWKP
jgi:uncharacterized membrane protein